MGTPDADGNSDTNQSGKSERRDQQRHGHVRDTKSISNEHGMASGAIYYDADGAGSKAGSFIATILGADGNPILDLTEQNFKIV